MNAVLHTVRSDVRRRKLQTAIIAVVIFLTSGAVTLALSLLVESNAPYDHAFAAANGAHITLTYNASHLSLARLRHTASASPVTNSAGPFPQVVTVYTADTQNGQAAGGLAFVGRSTPTAAVDKLTVESGRWAAAAGEVVVSQRLADRWGIGIGDHLNPGPGSHGPSLTVSGIAASISPLTDAWVLPSEIPHMVSRSAPLQEQMLYRVVHSSTDAQLQAASQSITAGLPRDAVTAVNTYLTVEQQANLTTNVMIPFLLAFSAFALVASILIIVNVVSGVVISSYRDIGVMKAIGFTPAQVVAVLLGEVLGPVAPACLGGIAIGAVASQPFLTNTAHALGLPSAFTAAIPVDLGVFTLIVVASALATLVPARRAARLDAVTAITMGTSPSSRAASRLARATARLHLPTPLSLGLADTLSAPARSLMTAIAVFAGVTTAVFALDLHLSLGAVADHLSRDKYVQVTISVPSGGSPLKGGGPPPGFPTPPSNHQVAAMLRHAPGTAHFVAEGQTEVTVPGLAEPITYYAYRGPSAWTGYALISGRWFARPGEVVAPTALLASAHLHVGQTITAHHMGRSMRLTIVGEIFDQTDNDLLLRGTWATIAATEPHLSVDQYEVQLIPGTNPAAYVRGLHGPGVGANFSDSSSDDATFILLNSVIAALALVLIFIATAGVFNTVVLATREKARDIAILKAVGMAPRTVVTMVLASVGVLGVVAGALGIPAGIALHRQVLTVMGAVASGTRIPPAFFDLVPHVQLPLLALAGVAIAVIGAWFPAIWAARSPVAHVLQAE
jgi:putative ABC transport system permease protein